MKHGDMIVERRPVGPFAMNSYLIGCAKTGAGAIVDSGGETDEMLGLAESHGLQIEKLLQTHAHIDHVMGLKEMKEKTGAPIYLHPADAPIYMNAGVSARMFGLQLEALPPIDCDLAEGAQIALGSLRFRVLFTPGHAPGHVCYWEEELGVLFGGDLIFQGSIGRVDLPLCNPSHMQASLLRVRDALPDETIIYPGHMGSTTMGSEKRTNPFLLQL